MVHPMHNNRPRAYDTVFFDLGNTLMYFDGDWPSVSRQAGRALAKTLKTLGYSLETQKFVGSLGDRIEEYYREREMDFIEDTTEYVLRCLLTEYGYSDVPPAHLRSALDTMYAVTETYWHLENDAISTLQKLQSLGYHMGLISNAADSKDVNQQLERTNLKSFFEIVLISADVGLRKPHPRIFTIALQGLGSLPRCSVMVGDTLGADILGALNAGMASIWITRRANTPENRLQREMVQPDGEISTLAELPDLLENWKV